MWPSARNLHNECGPYQIVAVLRERGIKVPIEELYFTESFRKRDWTIPWHVTPIFARYGIRSRMRFWSRASFVAKLARAIERGPVLFVIKSIRGTGNLHWISARGYDAATQEFICYDSQAEPADEGLGNIRYTASDLLAALPTRLGTLAIEIEK